MSENKVHQCCVSGFNWDGTPVGREEQVNGNATYVSGSNTEVAILMIHDLFGWKFNNLRLLADHYASEVNATVYLPDLYVHALLQCFACGQIAQPGSSFDGESLPRLSDILAGGLGEAWKDPEVHSFIARNGKDIRRAAMFDFARHLRPQYKRLGAIGYCYGGWAVFELGAKENKGLVDCISVAHPSMLTTQDIDRVGVPVQMVAPERDPAFTHKLRDHAHRVLPENGVTYDYQYFPGVEHAFAVRGNRSDEVELKAMSRAKDAAVSWFKMWLH
jgi:dienelactone hydrolase